MADGTQTAEKPETIVLESAAPKAEAAALPTRAELQGKGWTEKELAAGEKRGMIAKDGALAPEPVKKEEVKPEAAAEGAVKPEVKPKPSTMPVFEDLTPEKEKAFTDAFGPGTPQRALYFRMKNERHARQASEARIRELEAQLKATTTRVAAPEPELDAEGKPIDPEGQPLTLKALKKLQQDEAAELQRRQAEQQGRVATLTAAQTEQEEYVRNEHPDFDRSVELAKDVIKNFEAMFPEKWKQTKVLKQIRDLQLAAAHADKMGLDDHNAARVAYELGQMHPDWGQDTGAEPENTGARKDPTATGGLKPDQMKRIQANTQRRPASAAAPAGGGKRTISVEDVDLKTLNGMTYSERKAFKEKHPEQYGKLLRG